MAAATDGGARRWRPTPIKARKLGLAAVKHQQQQAERTEPQQQGRAFVALAHVVADAGGGGWPEQHDARFAGLPDAAGAQRLGGQMGRVSQRTGGAREAWSAGATDASGRDAGGACQPS